MRVNLGSGLSPEKGFINLDIRPDFYPDVVCDIESGIPFDTETVDMILAKDFLEHVRPDKVIFVIEEIWRVLKRGGRFEHMTPSTDGRGAFQDPTHRSFWNYNSWFYFIHDRPRKEIGTKAKFKMIRLEDQYTSSENRIIHTHGIFEK